MTITGSKLFAARSLALIGTVRFLVFGTGRRGMGKPQRPWIARVLISDEVEGKLAVKHSVTPDEVEQAVSFGQFTSARWHIHPDYGERLLVKGQTDDGVELLVVLKPANEFDGIWECKTARRTRR